MRLIPRGLDATLEDTRRRIAGYRERETRFGFSKRLIIHRETGNAIGDSGLHHLPDGRRIELGFRLARPYWGAGYATEVGRAWIAWFDEHLRGEPLFADVHPDNLRSQRVLMKLGFSNSHPEVVLDMPMLIYFRNHGPESVVQPLFELHPTLTFAVAAEWAEPSSQIVMNGLLAYNATFCGIPMETKLAISARTEDGRLVAGLLGHTHHGWLYVGWLWVSEELRNQRIGTELMRRAEAEALDRECHHAHLTTLDFQARRFYDRLGYAVFGILDDYPRPHKRFFMQKQLLAHRSPLPRTSRE
jgi:RimJ/RimL family protein N-acetyltransferase